MNNRIDGKEILITGGTGSLGQMLAGHLLSQYKPHGIRIFSRGEVKQWEMKMKFEKLYPDAPIAYLIGDVRDEKRVKRAMEGCQVVFHCSALKQVPACEYNPFEALQTNTLGAKNVIEAALDNRVEYVMNVSTDKAVNPVNLYGATKLAAEKLFADANVYSKKYRMKTQVGVESYMKSENFCVSVSNIPIYKQVENRFPVFASCRYGNVVGSRGSIIPLFKKQLKEQGFITVTHPDMTRFWIRLNEVVRFITDRLNDMEAGSIYVPEIPSARIMDVARVILKEFTKGEGVVTIGEGAQADIQITGIRKGEKLHECLISPEEACYAQIFDCGYWEINENKYQRNEVEKPYYSNTNGWVLTKSELETYVKEEW